MTPRHRFWLVQAAGLALALGLLLATARPRQDAEGSLLLRLLGPGAVFAAKVEWVRFDLALRAGELELAYARADTALWIDPGSTEGWNAYAAHLCFDRASEQREPDPTVRRAWFDAALATLARGETVARAPAELAVFAGLIREDKAEFDPAIAGPGGARALRLAAAEDYERAARLGKQAGTELAARARERAGR